MSLISTSSYTQDGPSNNAFWYFSLFIGHSVFFAKCRTVLRITHGYMQDGPVYNAFRFFAIYRTFLHSTVLRITSAFFIFQQIMYTLIAYTHELLLLLVCS